MKKIILVVILTIIGVGQLQAQREFNNARGFEEGAKAANQALQRRHEAEMQQKQLDQELYIKQLELQAQKEQIEAQAIINVQNYTDKIVYFCYAAYNSSNGWQSVGWFKIEAYSNENFKIGHYSGTIYLYAQDITGEKSWGDENSKASFCVDKSNPFNIANADSRTCDGSNYKRVKMAAYNIKPGTFPWKLTP